MWTDLKGVQVHRALVAAALVISASLARAQGLADRVPRPDPLDARASVPAVEYRSPLSRYQRLGQDKPMPWKDANETVNRIGGWKAYAREAQQPEAIAPATSPATGDGRHKGR
jgi:hypothetical protein